MKNTIAISSVVILVAIIGYLVFRGGGKPNEAYALDEFAKCLSQKGLTMYGAYWCPHCQNEKKEFGSSFSYVNYVECTEETKKCTDAGISGYPTWITADGQRFEGEQGIKRLAGISSCSLSEKITSNQ